MFTVVVFIIVLGILVFVHELGHFIVARRNGVRAEEFGFGFPPRAAGFYWSEHSQKWKFVRGSREIKTKNTIYSLNWIPLGGFVKIKGEDGEGKNDPQSFSGKPAFLRIRILAAGVVMNFILAAVLFSLAFFIGVPQVVDSGVGEKTKDEKIQVVEVAKSSPAEAMGIKMGDELAGGKDPVSGEIIKFQNLKEVQNFINDRKGQEITLAIKRGSEPMELTGIPRTDLPSGEGALGISYVETAQVSYPWYRAIYEGVTYAFQVAWLIISTFVMIIWKLIARQPAGLDVSGPVGIAVLTGQVARLGFVYILQFTAMLSINLAIINAFPIPALDGGRILFILIEKIKGSPVSQRFEQRAHNIGFALLITLMIFVTAKDLVRLDLIEKIKTIF
ncbi:MAG: RIP metalloprotease RseP [Candidatus Moranbacteria bacterium]|nr:RIP metalloprotease RseP [Candidatus Moranbacteria bacterium]